jgi:hypothetical protein
MAQIFSHTLIDAETANGTYGLMTNQAQHVARTIYVTGPYTGTVSIEASPVMDGDDWHEVFTTTAVGAQNFDVDPLVCHRLRGKLASMLGGTVTVKIVSRYESY